MEKLQQFTNSFQIHLFIIYKCYFAQNNNHKFNFYMRHLMASTSIATSNETIILTNEYLVSNKKLLLVLDLDHTLLHTVSPRDWKTDRLYNLQSDIEIKILIPNGYFQDQSETLTTNENEMLDLKSQSQQNKDAYEGSEEVLESGQVNNYNAAGVSSNINNNNNGRQQVCYIKLRPGIFEMLEQLSSKFELCIYSAGLDVYVNEVMKYIDPTKKYFKNRVFARSSCNYHGSTNQLSNTILNHNDFVSKHLSKISTVDKRAVIILDDRVDVWTENSENVLQVFGYKYFGRRARDTDDILPTITNVLNHIHTLFYNSIIFDTPSVLKKIRLDVLRGCVIVFTGFNSKDPNLSISDSPEWNHALRFGATCSKHIDINTTTHLIARQYNFHSKKIMDVERINLTNELMDVKHKIHIVSINWLYQATSHYLSGTSRPAESTYSLHYSKPERQ